MGNCFSSTSADPAAAAVEAPLGKNKEEESPKEGAIVQQETSAAEAAGAPPPTETSAATGCTTCTTTPLCDENGNEQLGADYDRNTLEENDYEGPSCLQEELNEMLEAVYALISEEDIQSYQRYLQGIQKQQIAEQAAKALSKAPGFELMDQDNDKVSLEALCDKGPVVLQFYRGKWCPHCNAGLMAYNKYLKSIAQEGATLVAISPMLPDGSQFLASKRDLNFAVLSDCGNIVAREYKVTFVVPEEIRPTFEAWGHDVAKANGDDLWEVPLAATYVINKRQEIVWSFVDNDHGCWAEPSDVVKALQEFCGGNDKETATTSNKNIINTNAQTRGKGSVKAQKPTRSIFGPKKQSALDYVSGYPS